MAASVLTVPDDWVSLTLLIDVSGAYEMEVEEVESVLLPADAAAWARV